MLWLDGLLLIFLLVLRFCQRSCAYSKKLPVILEALEERSLQMCNNNGSPSTTSYLHVCARHCSRCCDIVVNKGLNSGGRRLTNMLTDK